MQNLRTVFLSIVMLMSCQSFGMQVLRDNQGYRVFDGKQCYEVKSYDADPLLRKVQVGQLRKFVQDGGRIRATKLDNGDYVLRASIPGKVGGPILASIFYGQQKLHVMAQ